MTGSASATLYEALRRASPRAFVQGEPSLGVTSIDGRIDLGEVTSLMMSTLPLSGAGEILVEAVASAMRENLYTAVDGDICGVEEAARAVITLLGRE